MKHIPRKRFGQHFLVDPAVIDDIVSAIAPRPGETLVEIGPGLGALTVPLLARVPHLHVVEIDRDIIARLTRTHAPDRLTVHAGDALAFDFSALGPDLRIVGNLPYNISTPLLFHLMGFADGVRDLHFMLQKEVVDRMVAAPGGRDYGRLSVMLQLGFAMESLFDVPPAAFDPPPKVNSAVVRMIPRPASERPDVAPDVLGRVVTAAFSQRRKMVRNTLKGVLDGAAFERLGVSPMARAEDLSPETYVRIAQDVATSL